jgi:hypothetical protein
MCISTGRAARCEDGLDGSGLSLTTDACAPLALWRACEGGGSAHWPFRGDASQIGL